MLLRSSDSTRYDMISRIVHWCRSDRQSAVSAFRRNVTNVMVQSRSAQVYFESAPMQEEIDKLLLEIQRSRFNDRRTEPRQPFVRPVQIHLPQGSTTTAFSKDLSAQGIGIISNVVWPTGTIAELEIHSTTGDPVILRCEARWCDPYGKGWFVVGWKFIGVASRPVS